MGPPVLSCTIPRLVRRCQACPPPAGGACPEPSREEGGALHLRAGDGDWLVVRTPVDSPLLIGSGVPVTIEQPSSPSGPMPRMRPARSWRCRPGERTDRAGRSRGPVKGSRAGPQEPTRKDLPRPQRRLSPRQWPGCQNLFHAASRLRLALPSRPQVSYGVPGISVPFFWRQKELRGG